MEGMAGDGGEREKSEGEEEKFSTTFELKTTF